MTIKVNDSEKNINVSPQESYFGCGFSILGAIVLIAVARLFHGFLIPQALQENAYFIEGAPYILVYLLSIPSGLVLGYTTYLAKLWQSTQPKRAADNLSLVSTVGILFSCYIFYRGFEPTDPILQQNNLSYILAANLPWMAPIFLWSLFLLCWSFKIRKQIH